MIRLELNLCWALAGCIPLEGSVVTEKPTNEEVKQLKLQVAALEELLAAREQTILEQSRKLEQQIAEHKRTQDEMHRYREELQQLMKAHTAELQQSRQFLHTIVDSIPTPIFYKDTEGAYLGFNQAFLDYIGKSEKDLLGKTVYDLNTDQALANQYHQADLDLILNPGVQTYEASVKYADGSYHDVIFTKSTFSHTDSNVDGLIGTMIDITERKQAEEILLKRAAELETVAQVSQAVSSVLRLNELLQLVTDLTKDRFNLYHAHVYLLNGAGDALELVAGAGNVGRQMVAKGWHIRLEHEQSLVAKVARTKQGVIINNIQQEPGYFQNPLLPHTQAEMAVPMVVGEQLLGVLDVQANQVNYFTQEDIYIQSILAAQISVAIRNAKLYQQTETQARREQLLRNITTRVRDSVDVDTVMRTAAQEIGQALGRPTYVHLGSGNGLNQTHPLKEKDA